MRAFLLVLVCVSLAGCQSRHRREVAISAVLVNQLNLMAAQEIAHEKNGDPPPKGFPNWRAFWQNRIFALKQSVDNPRNRHVNIKQITDDAILFIMEKRRELGLPPLN
jgi:hypothetical protein